MVYEYIMNMHHVNTIILYYVFSDVDLSETAVVTSSTVISHGVHY